MYLGRTLIKHKPFPPFSRKVSGAQNSFGTHTKKGKKEGTNRSGVTEIGAKLSNSVMRGNSQKKVKMLRLVICNFSGGNFS